MQLIDRSLLMGMFEKKTYTKLELGYSLLSRCLTTLDLTALGVGTTLGAGVYVVAGKVAKETAGPGVILSFLIAAIASVLAGLCYAEFGAHVPRTGSAYIYSYVTVGELMAFIIGWNMILEYIIGTASVARAWSANFDEITGGYIKSFFLSKMPMNVNWLSNYPDFFALLVTLILTAILCLGVKESSRFNNIFTLLNITVLLYAVICGLWNADINNWKINPKKINYTDGQVTDNKEIGDGYFLPFGIIGVLSGAGTCFYAFVGFDCISTTGEEVINPTRALPIAIISSLFICFIAYGSISAVITLMCPYYLLNPDAPLPYVFERIGWTVSKYIIGIGAMFGLSTSLLGGLLPLPRIIYAMSFDGLLFKFLSRVNERFKTPIIATFISGSFAAVLAAMFDLKDLVDMMSIGTLLAYTLVAFSILLLRGSMKSASLDDSTCDETKEPDIECNINVNEYLRNVFKRRTEQPTKITDFIFKITSYLIFISVFVLDILVIQDDDLKNPARIFFVVLFAVLVIVFSIILCIQPKSSDKVSFRVPGVPWVPTLSMFVNLYLMMKLPVETWYRFGIWMTIGFLIYFCYGICHSEERQKRMNTEHQNLLRS